jgi:hypothetical protein
MVGNWNALVTQPLSYVAGLCTRTSVWWEYHPHIRIRCLSINAKTVGKEGEIYCRYEGGSRQMIYPSQKVLYTARGLDCRSYSRTYTPITGRVQLSSAFMITGFHPTSNGINPINYTFIQPRILTIACCAVYIQLAARINISRGVATWVVYTVYIHTLRCSDTYSI